MTTLERRIERLERDRNDWRDAYWAIPDLIDRKLDGLSDEARAALIDLRSEIVLGQFCAGKR